MPDLVPYKRFELTFWDEVVYSHIPPHPFWDQVAKLVDFSFADKLCMPLYSSQGQHPYPPSLKLKIHLVQRHGNLSDRQTEETIIGNLFIKRFLGLPLDHCGLDHGTIALDRARMGDELFDACFHHVLEQARMLGLWGAKDDLWLIDSFYSRANVAAANAYRLVQQAMIRLLHLLKRRNREGYERLQQDMDLSAMVKRFPRQAEKPAKLLAFSRLIVLSYGLLAWFEHVPLTWKRPRDAQTCAELQALLRRILKENVRPQEPSAAATSSTEQDETIRFAELGKGHKPGNRIVSAFDPDVRVGHKHGQYFTGDKVQVLASAKTGLILEVEPIAGNEGDGQRLAELVKNTADRHKKAKRVPTVGDSAYAHGPQRQAMKNIDMEIIGPVADGENPTGLYPGGAFQYDETHDRMICPEGHTSRRKTHIRQSHGTQYIFARKTCAACPLRSECTTSKETGRTVFVSDFARLLEDAKAFNETPQGQAALRLRYRIEPRNNHLKNHLGLGRARTRGRPNFRKETKLAGMVANLKVIVKLRGHQTPAFLRHPTRSRKMMPVCG